MSPRPERYEIPRWRPRGRILRLSEFFSKPNRLRGRSERTLPKQVFVIPLTRLVES